ncbi:hypothetical protein CLOSCI_04051 [[Clostridium] scindens ATCC 35704]|nr:hypothetical protein CLOSCI_04051 [[Clostridium] scindens ATCC 35704]
MIRYHIPSPPLISICIFHNKLLEKVAKMHTTEFYLNIYQQKNKEEITYFC